MKKQLLIVGLLLISTTLWAEVSCKTNLDEAFSIAQSENKKIALKIYADWCPDCQALKKEIYQTEDGEDLFKSLICVNVDFDSKYGQGLVRKYRVIGLPSVLFLSPDGREIGRVIGYPGKDKFVAAANKYSEGSDPLPILEAKLQKEPNNPRYLYEVGEKYIQRGEDARGVEYLTKAINLDAGNLKQIKEKALFVLGRYYSRVKDDAKSGLKYWQELYLKYHESEYWEGAMSWMLKGYKQLGKLDEAYIFIKEDLERHPASFYPYYAMALFQYKYKETPEKALEYANKGLELKPNNEGLLGLLEEIKSSH